MSSALPELVGARVDRVDGPRRGVFAASVSTLSSGRLVLVLFTGPDALGWGVSDVRPRGEAASSLVRLLRKHLCGSRIVELTASEHGGTIALERGPGRIALHLVETPPHLRIVIDEEPLAIPTPQSQEQLRCELPEDLASARAVAAARLEHAAEESLDARRRALRKLLAARERKLGRRLDAIDQDLAAALDAGRLRSLGTALLAELHRIPQRATEATVTDWTLEPPQSVSVPIDPRRGPKGEADALFRRARKLERAGVVGTQRARTTRDELDRVSRLRERLESGDDLDEIGREAARLGVGSPARAASARTSGERPPFRTYVGSGGRRILVGRSAADNDALTLRHARPHDLWLHAQGTAGSHVVVPLERGEACPPELLIDAAHLAARFSSARGDVVEVVYVPRRYVRKRRGAAAGQVSLEREKVVALRIEPARMRRLLESERQPAERSR